MSRLLALSLSRAARSLALVGILTGIAAMASAAAQQEEGAPVGLSVSLRDFVIPGAEVVVAPSDETTPVVVRLADVYSHGDAFRYDLVFYGLDPGKYNLLDFLRRKDGSRLDEVAPHPIVILSLLPEGIVKPHALEARQPPSFSSYKLLMWTLAVLWVIGLFAILRYGRSRERHAEGIAVHRQSMAERLRPLVTKAMAGELSANARAELEMLLIAFWRRKRGLEAMDASESLQQLRADKEAGPLLKQVEKWLHSPDSADSVDLEALLAPYESLPAEEGGAPLTETAASSSEPRAREEVSQG